MQCQFQVYSRLIQLHIYIYIHLFFFRFLIQVITEYLHIFLNFLVILYLINSLESNLVGNVNGKMVTTFCLPSNMFKQLYFMDSIPFTGTGSYRIKSSSCSFIKACVTCSSSPSMSLCLSVPICKMRLIITPYAIKI